MENAADKEEGVHPVSVYLSLSIALMIIRLSLILLFTFQAVGAQPSGPGLFALRNMLDDKRAEIRIKAAEGLARVGGRQSVVHAP